MSRIGSRKFLLEPAPCSTCLYVRRIVLNPLLVQNQSMSEVTAAASRCACQATKQCRLNRGDPRGENIGECGF